jgi:hypothetical protein
MTMIVKWVLCTDVEVGDDHVRVILDCGHSYEARPHWNSISIEDYYKIIAQMIGKQQRCPECEMAQLEIERQVP